MLQSLQACRAIAALLVVLYHADGSIFALSKYFGSRPFGQVFEAGHTGVYFFFVLSGFIMMRVHEGDFGHPERLGAYLWKRFSRIYPTYWVVLLCLLPVFFVLPNMGLGHERDVSALAASFSLVPTPHPEKLLILSVAWTLIYEVFFYAMFAVLLVHRRAGMALLLGWALIVTLQAGPGGYPWTFLFSSLHFYFLTGIVVALATSRCRLPAPLVLAALGAIQFLGAGWIEVYHGKLSVPLQWLGYAGGCGLIILGVVQAEERGHFRLPRLLTFLGDASYSIYLTHFPALSLLAKVGKSARLDERMPGIALFVLLVVAATSVGCLFHWLVERPLMRWSKQRFKSSRRSAAEAFALPLLPMPQR